MKFHQALPLVVFSASLTVHATAASITVDGDLSDWGLHRNGNISDWTPNALISPSRYSVEDQTGYSYTRLYPGYGGQAYDTEAFYAYLDTSNLYLALVTGLAPNTVNAPTQNSYGPGDFAIDFGRDGSFEFGIETTGSNAGKIYKVSSWDYGLWNNQGQYDPKHPDLKHPTSIHTGILISDVGQLIYSTEAITHMGIYTNDKHYVIEASVPLIAFGGFTDHFDVHWTMNCANDAIWIDPELISVPEPASLLLLALGFLALALLQRKKPFLSFYWTDLSMKKNSPKWHLSTARLLRRDVRNNTVLFKYLRQRKYTFL